MTKQTKKTEKNTSPIVAHGDWITFTARRLEGERNLPGSKQISAVQWLMGGAGTTEAQAVAILEGRARIEGDTKNGLIFVPEGDTEDHNVEAARRRAKK